MGEGQKLLSRDPSMKWRQQQPQAREEKVSRNGPSPFSKKKISLSKMNRKLTRSRGLGIGPSQADGERKQPASCPCSGLFRPTVWLSAEVCVWGGGDPQDPQPPTPIRATSIGLKALSLQSRAGLRPGPWGLERDTQRCYKIIAIYRMPAWLTVDS